MPTITRKIRKQRASRTHGWGQVGQHRASGGRGGKGKAGLFKHKWTWTVKYKPAHLFKRGFTPLSKTLSRRWINVGQLDDLALSLSKKTKSSAQTRIDLKEMGYHKLLGAGNVKGMYDILVDSISNSAKEKIESAGGTVVAGKKESKDVVAGKKESKADLEN